MSRDILQPTLDAIEMNLQQVFVAMRQHQSQQLMVASEELRRLSIELAGLVRRFPQASANKLIKTRLVSLAAMMGSSRSALIRQGVMAERALATLMPSVQATTYKPAATGRLPYGSVGRQSGEFRSFVA